MKRMACLITVKKVAQEDDGVRLDVKVRHDATERDMKHAIIALIGVAKARGVELDGIIQEVGNND